MSTEVRPSNPLVQRLRNVGAAFTSYGMPDGVGLLIAAADEIERLTAENFAKDRHMADYHRLHDELERLRAALARIRDYDGRVTKNWPGSSQVARGALLEAAPADETTGA